MTTCRAFDKFQAFDALLTTKIHLDAMPERLKAVAECIAAAEAKVAQMGLIAPIAGHVGDGNFHHLILVDPENTDECTAASEYIGWLNDLAISFEGTCSGEHGIGQGKRRYLAREAGEALRFMAAVKTAFDPKGIMNPGKMLPDDASVLDRG